MCLPCVSTKLITMGKIFVCLETLIAVRRKPESICSELNHVLLRSLMVSLCIQPCPNTVSTIVGLSRQHLFVVVPVVFSTEAPNQLNILNIPSVCPWPENGAPFVCNITASVFELTVHCGAICQVAFLKLPITQCTAKCSHIHLYLVLNWESVSDSSDDNDDWRSNVVFIHKASNVFVVLGFLDKIFSSSESSSDDSDDWLYTFFWQNTQLTLLKILYLVASKKCSDWLTDQWIFQEVISSDLLGHLK